jgi:hypothetical protein
MTAPIKELLDTEALNHDCPEPKCKGKVGCPCSGPAAFGRGWRWRLTRHQSRLQLAWNAKHREWFPPPSSDKDTA